MIRTGVFVALLTGVTVAHAAAQTDPLGNFVWVAQAAPPPPPQPSPGVPGIAMAAEAIDWLPFEINLDRSPVTGAPYSATAVTETTQTLSDGNRISRRMEATIYRDSEGRTRREQTLTGIGPIEMVGQGRQTVTINDPVSGEHYILDPEHLRVRKMKVFAPTDVLTSTAGVTRHIEIEERRLVNELPKVAETVTFTAGQSVGAGSGGVMTFSRGFGFAGEPQTESLGTQVIEGVSADGTKTTVVIPAGQIGNDRPIEIVSERWVSPELKTTVMSRHSDPRMGETVYRLTNLSRAEPDPALFQVPPDYTIEEMPGKGEFIRSIRKEP